MDYYWYTLLLLFLIGILIGTIAVLSGIGGGVIAVPLMTILFAVSEDISVGTSSLIILISSGFGFILLKRQKRINIRLCLICSIFTIIGSLISTILFIISPIDNYLLRLIFACVMIYVSINLIFRKDPANNNSNESANASENFSLEFKNHKKILKKGIPLFLLAGFLANLLGIGGGIVNTPTLHYIFQFPIYYATANSTGIIFFTSIYNVIVKSVLGKIDFIIGILMGTGGLIGAYFGAKISQKISRKKLTIILAIVLLIGSIRMFFP